MIIQIHSHTPCPTQFLDYEEDKWSRILTVIGCRSVLLLVNLFIYEVSHLSPELVICIMEDCLVLSLGKMSDTLSSLP